jgi:hypothetical protein
LGEFGQPDARRPALNRAGQEVDLLPLEFGGRVECLVEVFRNSVQQRRVFLKRKRVVARWRAGLLDAFLSWLLHSCVGEQTLHAQQGLLVLSPYLKAVCV